jgi:hypothetical protein
MTTSTNTVTVVLQITSPSGEAVFFYCDAVKGAAPNAPGKSQFASIISVLEIALTEAHRQFMPLPNDHDRN